MSYDKTINNYVIKFKDEESYLEAKLENLQLYSDIPFFGFIQQEMYDKEKCEVESIEPVQSPSADPFYTTDISSTTWPGSGGSLVIASGSGGSLAFEASDPTDIHIAGNLIVDGTITTTNGPFATWIDNDSSNFTIGYGVSVDEGEEKVKEESAEPQEPEDPSEPIDNRFDILDL